MAKKDDFVITKTEEIALNFYTVRSKDGKWLRAKKHHVYSGDFDSNGSWTENLVEAKIYTKPGPAKTQVTFWATHYPTFGVPDLVRITFGTCEYLDQAERVKKAAIAKEYKEAERNMRYACLYVETHAAKVKAMRGDGLDNESIRLNRLYQDSIKRFEKAKSDKIKK